MKSLAPHLVLAPDAFIDLQLHTTFSDGTWTPEQLIDYLVREQFGLVAITDHDRVDTAAELQQLAAEKHLPLLAAVEMSTSWRGEPTDVLCYGFDPEQNNLQGLAQAIMRQQRENTRLVCENLRKTGISFSQDELDVLLVKPSAQQPHELVAFLEKRGYGTRKSDAWAVITDAGFLNKLCLQPILSLEALLEVYGYYFVRQSSSFFALTCTATHPSTYRWECKCRSACKRCVRLPGPGSTRGSTGCSRT